MFGEHFVINVNQLCQLRFILSRYLTHETTVHWLNDPIKS